MVHAYFRRLLLVVAMVAAATGAFGLPAATATHGDPGCPHDLSFGDQMRTIYCQSWRSTYVLDVGRFNLVSHQDLWRYHGVFNQYGFADNWLWYAPATQRTFVPGPDSGVKWASCQNDWGGVANPYPNHELPPGPNGSATGLCTDRIVPPSQQTHTLLSDFTQHPVTLSVFSFGGAFIARECGNFSTAPSQNPVPTISGSKYHDVNRNGMRDAGEPGLAGWTMRLVRDSSDLVPGQGTGATGLVTTTDANGNYSFALHGHGPGHYRVVEDQRQGWVQTDAPAAVHVPFGAGSHDYGANDLGNVEDRADVVKATWDVVAPPARIDAGVPTTLTVRATITNTGPAPEVDVVDTMTATGQSDCVLAPREQAVTRRLRLNEPVVVEFDVVVTCEDPSNHAFVFDNVVAIVGPAPEDPDPANNARSTTVTIPVFDDSDARLGDATLDCPARIDVATPFDCTGTVLLTNDGPYGATGTDVAFGIDLPADCAAEAGPAGSVQDVAVPASGAVPVTFTWRIACANRSYHPMSMTATATLDHVHVEDHVPANDTVTASDTVEVFEAADLSIVPRVRIACGGRLPSITSFGCDVRVTIANAGPATAVATETTTTVTAPPDCVVTPPSATQPATLNAGAQTTLTFHYDLVCADAVLHTVLATATVTTAEPHAEDRDPSPPTTVRWVPTDVKPRSDPSSVNAGKEGVVPVSILSTPEFDAVSSVDRSTLTWGVTGYEPSLVACGGSAEDTNGDGLVDLVCRFDTKVAGITCTTTSATLLGYLKDGTPIESQDPVNVTGCKK